jgi:hypothetical protein
MSLSSLCHQCKQSAGIKCLHCSQNFCRSHFREHEENIYVDIHPLIDRLNNLTEQSLRIDEQKKFLINELHQWKEASYRIIDNYCQIKHNEIEEKIKEFYKPLQQVKDQMKPLISNQLNDITHEQIKTFQYKLNELEKTMTENLPTLQLNPLHIDSKLISFISTTSILSLLDLKIPKRTYPIKFDTSPMATDGKLILLQDTTHSLGLYEYDTLSLHRQITWSSTDLSNIIDLHWSNRLKQFLILTREHFYTLNKDFIRSNTCLKTNNDFRTMTTDDDHDQLFLANSTSIEEYSLSTFIFSKRYNINEQNIYSLRFNSNTNQFGLTVRTCHEHKWYFEVRNRSMIRLWSILTPIKCGLCSVTILSSCNEWIIVNVRGDILFQVTNDGHMKSEVIYGGRNLLNAIEINKKILVIRTYGYLEQYEL